MTRLKGDCDCLARGHGDGNGPPRRRRLTRSSLVSRPLRRVIHRSVGNRNKVLSLRSVDLHIIVAPNRAHLPFSAFRFFHPLRSALSVYGVVLVSCGVCGYQRACFFFIWWKRRRSNHVEREPSFTLVDMRSAFFT